MKLSNRGQGLIEYLILMCLIGISAIGVVTLIGTNLKEQYANVSRALDGRQGENKGLTKPKDTVTKHRGMGDYWESAEGDK